MSETVGAVAPRVLIAIVNYRTAALAVDCLLSLVPELRGFPGTRVVIADNDSQDGSVEFLRTAIARHELHFAEVLALPKNGGFAHGNNVIVAQALSQTERPDYVLLLNPDTTVLPGLLPALLGFFAAHPRAGIVGAHQQDPDGTALCSSFRFPTPLGELSAGLRLGVASRLLQRWEVASGVPEQPARCDWVSGGCMMVRRDVFERIGLLDEAYFLYYEETDFCLRARDAGFECWFLPEARIHHIGGQSTGVTGIHRRPSRRPRYWFDSRRRFFLKNQGARAALAADALFLLGFASFRVRRVLQQKPDPDPPRFLGDFAQNSVFARGFSLLPARERQGDLPALGVGHGAPDLEALRAALLGHTAVSEFVVREGKDRPCAYVVLSRELTTEELCAQLHVPVLLADDLVLLDRLPRDEMGAIDDVALARHPRGLGALARVLEAELRAHGGVERAAVLAVPQRAAAPRLHLEHLLPDARAQVEPDGPEPSQLPPPSAEVERRPMAESRAPALTLSPGAAATLVEALEHAARRFPGPRILHLAEDGHEYAQSFDDLLDEARRVQAGLEARACGPGRFVILQLHDTRDILGAFWGALFAGAVPVIVPMPASYAVQTGDRDKLCHVFRLLGAPLLVTTGAQRPSVLGLADVIALPAEGVASLEELRRHAPAIRPHAPAPDDVAFLSLSSGSTGLPKCIQLTHRNILARGRGTNALCGQTQDDVVLNWLPFDHIGSISDWHLRCVDLGCRMVYCAKERILGRPLAWLDLIERHRISHSWAPNFAYALIVAALGDAADAHWDLSSMKSLLTAGEAVSSSTVDEFLTRLSRHGLERTAIRPAFGMAELGSGITYYQPTREAPVLVHTVDRASLASGLVRVPSEHPRAISFSALGPVIPGMAMRIVDEARNVLPEATIGQLHVRGLALSPGYYQNDEANRVFLDDGWFDTGDQGFLAAGQLYLTGRSKDCIIIHGANYFPAELEKVAEEVRGVAVSFTAAYTVRPTDSPRECLALFFVPERADDENLGALVRAIQERLAQKVRVKPDFFVPLAASDVPKTGIGKIQRKQLAARFEAGEFREILQKLDLLLGNERTLPDFFARPMFRPAALLGERPRTSTPRIVIADAHGLSRVLCATPELGSALLIDHDTAHGALASMFRAALGGQASLEVIDLRGFGGEPLPYQTDVLGEFAPPEVDRTLGLLRALESAHGEARVRLWVVSSHAQSVRPGDRLCPARGLVPPLLASAARAAEWLDVHHVDLCPKDELESHALALLAELAGTSRDVEIAYRGGLRHAPALADVRFPGPDQRAIGIVRGGLYVITGGLGGIGVELSERLLTRHGARLLLLGRSPVAGAKSARLARLTALGEVRHGVVDETDPVALEQQVREAERAFGSELAGVFHLAGIAREGEVFHETWQGLSELLAPKLFLALALDFVLATRPSAFVVHFSSLESRFPSGRTGAYAAACRALDLWSAHEREVLGRRSYALCFSAFDGLGMNAAGAPEPLLRARGMLPLKPAQGLDALAALLGLPPGNYGAGLWRAAPNLAAQWLGESHALHVLQAFASGPALPGSVAARDREGLEVQVRVEARDLPVTPLGDVDHARLLASLATGSRVYVAPRSDVERTLVRLFEQVIGVERVGVTDSFFDLGGSSLMSLRLFGLIEQKLGKKLAAATLYDAPTIERLALLFEQPAAFPERQSVFPLTSVRPGPALFLVHDADGETVLYGNLARQLEDELPVYAIRPEGRDGVALTQTRIEDMAAHYVAKIRALQPEGPYFLGGLCSGGVVAFEIARQLEAAGQRIGLVALLDSADAHAAPRSVSRARGDRFLSLLRSAEVPLVDKLRAVGEKMRNVAVYEAARRSRESYDRASFLLLRQLVDRGLALPPLLRRVTPRMVYHFAHAEYEPGVLTAKLVLVRASERVIVDEPGLDDTPAREMYEDPLLGWGHRAAQLDLIDTGGGHSSMLREPYVKPLASALRARILAQLSASH